MADVPRKGRAAARSRLRNVASPTDPGEPSDVEVGWQLDDGTERRRPWPSVSTDELAAATPWRIFRWYKGQKHYSGLYWSATTRTHVPYESRLELTRLLDADFDTAVSGIVSQPFLLSAVVDGQRRRHVPDYLLMSDDGPIVVDVKPEARLGNPKVASTLAWAKRAIESRGWRFEVSCEPAEQRASNIRFLAGYRRDWLSPPGLLDELRAADLNGLTLAEAVTARSGWEEPLVRAALFHLLWRGDYQVELDTLLTPKHVIGALS